MLANPPFKGAIDAADVNPSLPAKCKKTEILFLHLFLRLLENGGRAAVIVPDGVLFGSSNAHVEIRKKLIEENRLDGVVSMPSGVFRPYAGVSTAVLLFTKGRRTERIWFYDMEHDGFSLDDKRQRVPENDIPDLLDCWQHRHDAKFQKKRDARLAELQKQIAPLKTDRLKHHAIIHRLKFEEVVATNDGDKARTAREKAEAELAELERANRAAGKGNQPARPPVLGDQGSSRRREIRPLRQPLPACRAGGSVLRETWCHAGTPAAVGSTRHPGSRRFGEGCCLGRGCLKGTISDEHIWNSLLCGQHCTGHCPECIEPELRRSCIGTRDSR